MLYFSYCIKLGRSEEEFFNNSLSKTLRILEINLYGIEKKQVTTKTVYSMRDFLQ